MPASSKIFEICSVTELMSFLRSDGDSNSLIIELTFVKSILSQKAWAWFSYHFIIFLLLRSVVFCFEISLSVHEVLSWSKECPSLKIGSVLMMSKLFKSFRDSTEANM